MRVYSIIFTPHCLPFPFTPVTPVLFPASPLLLPNLFDVVDDDDDTISFVMVTYRSIGEDLFSGVWTPQQ